MESPDEEDKHLSISSWLVKMLSSNGCPSLDMIDNSQLKFKIPWKNEKKGGLQPGQDNTLFIESWARHKKYPSKHGERLKDLIDWKCKFRNSLNSFIKKNTGIKRLSNEDTEEYIVCQFEETYLHQQSNRLQLNFSLSTTEQCLETRNTLPNLPMLLDTSQEMFPGEKLQNSSEIISHENVDMESDPLQTANTLKEDKKPLLILSINYGIPHSHVKTIALTKSRVDCRLYYPSCMNAGVHQYLTQDGMFPVELPGVDQLPEFNMQQRGNILEILDQMDRGISLMYRSGDIYLERRTSANVYVSSHILDNVKLPRRKTRHEEPQDVKVFDIKQFMSQLNNRQFTLCTHWPKNEVVITFSPDSSPSRQGIVDSYVHVVVTQLSAFEELNRMTIKRKPTSMLQSYDKDDLDILQQFLRNAYSIDNAFPENHPILSAISTLSDQELCGCQSSNNIGIKKIEPSYQTVDVFTMMIDIYCDIPKRFVAKHYIPMSKNYCRIFAGDNEILKDTDNFNGSTDICILLPQQVDSTEFNQAKEINEILKSLDRGIHIKYVNEDIYVERRCLPLVYHTDGLSQTFSLERRKFKAGMDTFTKVFDYREFKNALEQMKTDGEANVPSAEFKLTIGSRVDPELPSMMNVFLYVSITHLPALQDLSTYFGHRRDKPGLLLSNPDSIDRIIQFLKDLHHNKL